jgi:cytidylate kinase
MLSSKFIDKIVIAVDGYSSCGKSTLAKAIARRIGIKYIDSGAMYRAVTLFFLQNNIDIPQPEEIELLQTNDYNELLNNIFIEFKLNTTTRQSEIYLNDVLVENQIREMVVSENVSHVSAIKEVRIRMVTIQQQYGEMGGIIMDGRDIGTTVFPNAELKIFMTADVNIRAQRRYREMINKGMSISYEQVLSNLQSRDYEDSHRNESPLRMADDAVLLDNSNINEEEQIQFVLSLIENLSIEQKVF